MSSLWRSNIKETKLGQNWKQFRSVRICVWRGLSYAHHVFSTTYSSCPVFDGNPRRVMRSHATLKVSLNCWYDRIREKTEPCVVQKRWILGKSHSCTPITKQLPLKFRFSWKNTAETDKRLLDLLSRNVRFVVGHFEARQAMSAFLPKIKMGLCKSSTTWLFSHYRSSSALPCIKKFWFNDSRLMVRNHPEFTP